MESSVSCTCQTRERVISSTSGDVGRHLGRGRAGCARGAGGTLVGRVLARITGGTLHEMYCVAVFDLDAAECVWVLEHAARVDEALAVGGDVGVVGTRQLGLEVGDGGSGGQSENMFLVVGSLHVEGDLALVDGRGGVVSHVVVDGL